MVSIMEPNIIKHRNSLSMKYTSFNYIFMRKLRHKKTYQKIVCYACIFLNSYFKIYIFAIERCHIERI